jgi:hypothetical protein
MPNTRSHKVTPRTWAKPVAIYTSAKTVSYTGKNFWQVRRCAPGEPSEHIAWTKTPEWADRIAQALTTLRRSHEHLPQAPGRKAP